MRVKLKFEHRQPNADWQKNTYTVLGPMEIAAQAAESHAESILNIVVGMSTEALDDYEGNALIHLALAIKNQMLDVQEMIAATQDSRRKS